MISSDTSNHPKQNDLLAFMAETSHEMESEYKRIQVRAIEDPGTAGDQGEENWATLLRGWLPHTYHVVTKGRILSRKGVASPQVDLLVLSPNYPNKLLDKKVYLAGGVLAAFECKLTLNSGHFKKTFKNAVKIRRQLPTRKGTPYKEFHSPILYGLLAHSHCWKEEKSKPIKNMERNINKNDLEIIKHPREMIDIICVADLATWVSFRIFSLPIGNLDKKIAGTAYIDDFQEQRQRGNRATTPIGTFITNLLHKLAWEDASLRELADYFLYSGVAGSGRGTVREWDSLIFSDETKQKILRRELTQEIWNEWSIGFK